MTSEQTRRQKAARQPKRNADQQEPRAALHYHRRDFAGAGAERYAHANLMSLLRHRAGHHAVDSDHRQRQSQRGEDREERQVEARAGVDSFLKNTVNRSDIGDRLVLINRVNLVQLVAVASTDVAFIVMMAGPGLTGEQILYRQTALVSKAAGMSDDLIAQNRAAQERVFAILKQEKDNVVAERRIIEEANAFREIAAKARAEAIEEQKKEISLIAAAIETQANLMVSPWFRFFLTYDPRSALMKVRCPVLAINGEKDLQVPAKENLDAIRLALEAGGNKDHTVLALPKLNHLFQTCRTGAISEYAQIEETMAPVAMDTISKWILRHIR